MNTSDSSLASRTAFRNAVNSIQAKGQYVVNRDPGKDPVTGKNDPPGAKTITMTQSYLRTRNVLSPSLTSYNFGILDSQPSSNPAGPANNINPIEQRLKLQDVFFVYELSFYLYITSTTSGNTSFQYEPCTFPNPNLFGSAANLDQMQQIWTTGQLAVTVNGNVLTPAYSLMEHLYVPRTQINPGNWPLGDNPQNYFNEFNPNTMGNKIIEPNWLLNGGNNNIFTLTYPTTLSNIGIGEGSQQFHIELFMKGFLAQNASSIMNNKAAS